MPYPGRLIEMKFTACVLPEVRASELMFSSAPDTPTRPWRRGWVVESAPVSALPT